MDTVAEITFVAQNEEKPCYVIKPHGQPAERRGLFDAQSVRILDARCQDVLPQLDANGFQLVASETRLAEDIEEADVPSFGYEEVEQAILATTGAAEVLIIDHTIRSSAPGNSTRGTARHAHVDYTKRSFMEKLKTLGISVGHRRVAQINAWRPLKEPVRIAPLALADCQSVAPNDLVACDLVYPDRRGQIYELRYRPYHRWYYYPEMTRDELLLFKSIDLAAPGTSAACPHSAFTHADETADLPARRSVEFRTCVLY
ncbi:CmcJ/NvfI family oxidoreductase [Leisingera methylohalidivorans]|uniref:Methyltransferase n=1 Tax=Leisingera methylohalidivorans DSM 14336 TaxID=999552 RepID=V9W0L5_9RHOB|nr:CmcJ/NvfI family oxidoreductase [Leisingera methylohalidivorans]AHD03683.1 hypothetical protein METH_22905 [Leisingera methylohalidivorans DSM 14336]